MTRTTMLAGATLLLAALTLACETKDDGDEGGGGAAATTSTTTSPTTTTPTTATSTGSTTSSAAGGAGGQGGAGPSGWTEGPPSLNNDAECLVWSSVYPDPGEEGHLYGVRLTPPSYPFEVTEVHYELLHTPSGETACDAQPAHRVEVFVAATDIPPATPMITQIDNAAVELSGDGIRVVKLTLPQPVTLQTGEHLFIAVEMPGLTACIMTCADAVVSDRDYWSNATMTPYSWATLSSYGIDVHARVGANGTAK